MSTEQSYVGREDSTTSTEPMAAQTTPTAQNGPLPHFQPDERLARIFASQQANEYLLNLLELLQEQKDTKNPISAINTIFGRWVNGEEMTGKEVINSFRHILDWLQLLEETASAFDCILIESDNENQF